MKKLLKIRFVKFEKALAMQQLEIKGYFVESERVLFSNYGVDFSQDAVWFAFNPPVIDCRIARRYFNSNTERDEYLNKVIKWISEEQFAANGKLEIGKMCEVSLCEGTEVGWVQSKLLAILPKYIENRYITQNNLFKNDSVSWTYARPLASCVQPIIEGDIYTWEMEVRNEKENSLKKGV